MLAITGVNPGNIKHKCIGVYEMQKNNWSEWAIFQELMRLISQYDWAVEGAPVPEGVMLTRYEATQVRNGLVKLVGEIRA